MKQFVKQKLIYFAKVIVGVALVAWLLMQVDQEKFFSYFLKLQLDLLIWVIILGVISLLIQFRRWKFLVESNSANYQIVDLLPSFFAGFAFRLMLPGGHAEFSKVFLLPGKKRGKVVAFGMEKFFQTYLKVIMILAVFPLTFPDYTWICVSILVVILIAYFFMAKIPLLKQLQEKKVNNHLVFAATTIYSVFVFLLMAAQYFLLLNEIHEISFLQTVHTVIYLWSAGIFPLSISGLGIREGLAVYFLRAYDIPAAHAVATSLFLFTLNAIIPALVGAVIIFRKRTYLKEMRQTVLSTRELINSFKRETHR